MVCNTTERNMLPHRTWWWPYAAETCSSTKTYKVINSLRERDGNKRHEISTKPHESGWCITELLQYMCVSRDTKEPQCKVYFGAWYRTVCHLSLRLRTFVYHLFYVLSHIRYVYPCLPHPFKYFVLKHNFNAGSQNWYLYNTDYHNLFSEASRCKQKFHQKLISNNWEWSGGNLKL